MNYTLFYSDKCPDTPPFVNKLQALGIDYQEVNVTDSMPNLKAFLKHRDQANAFDPVKEAGYVGVPVLVSEAGDYYFQLDQLEELGR